MKKHLLFILFILTGLNIFAQTYNMPTNGYLEIHSDSGTIYDDGGPTGNYSGNVNSAVTIYPSTSGARICLQGTFDLEDWMYSRIRFYDGDTNSNLEIQSWIPFYNSGTVDLFSSTGIITIRFNSDTETPKSGLEFNFKSILNTPTNIIHSLQNNNTSVNINWDGLTSSYWIVDIHNDKDYSETFKRDTTTSNNILID